MKQILQNLGNGETQVAEVPCPVNLPDHLLVRSASTLISAGTERMLVDFGKAGFIEKARQQPDKVKMVLNKVKTDGLLPTLEAVRSKLDTPLPLGYCHVGEILESGSDAFETGERVISNGHHAEIVRVPSIMCSRVPDNVSDQEAAFTVMGAIALQGIRLIQPTLGETVVVTGLGLIGLMAVQILKANGCRVLGIDYNTRKCELAEQFGAEIVDLSKGEDPIAVANQFSRTRGVDAVLITASSKSNDIVSQAATMCRKRGRIVLVGVVGLELSRADFYEKELSFQVSCSYGPGRYDPQYEEKGVDYPFAYVRWTEQRNFEAILDLMSSGQINVKPLISHQYEIEQAIEAYQQLENAEALGIIINYPRQEPSGLQQRTVCIGEKRDTASEQTPCCAFVGAGNYASRVLIPAFRKNGANLNTIVSSGGVSSVHHGQKNGFVNATTDYAEVLNDTTVNTVVIATRHNVHADQVCEAILAGKSVFVEKPLAISHDQIDKIESVLEQSGKEPRIMVGFNRRFAPHIQKMKALLEARKSPKSILITVNAGEIDPDHWTQDEAVGGGRIIGECCHFIDLMRYLTGSKIVSVQAQMMGAGAGVKVRDDKVSITLLFEDGSFGTIMYLANGNAGFPKERVEVFCDNAVLQLDNFRKMKAYGWPGFNKMNLMKQDKGQHYCVEKFLASVKNQSAMPIPFAEIIEVSRHTIDVVELLKK